MKKLQESISYFEANLSKNLPVLFLNNLEIKPAKLDNKEIINFIEVDIYNTSRYSFSGLQKPISKSIDGLQSLKK